MDNGHPSPLRIRLPVDAQRGIAASWHYHRALTLELHRRQVVAREGRRPIHLERMIVEHARIARGYLGAVGFEEGCKL